MLSLSTLDPRRLLNLPALYNLFQAVAGREKGARRVVKFLAISSGDHVLDIGCGTGDILQYLPADIVYHGFDLSEDYISAARVRFGAKGTFVTRAVTPDAVAGRGQFDVVIALGVLHHLSDTEADALFAIADRALRPEGRVVTCDGAFVPSQNPFARVLLRLDRGHYVRTPDSYLTIARRYFPHATAQIVHDLLFIPYTHCLIEGVKAA